MIIEPQIYAKTVAVYKRSFHYRQIGYQLTEIGYRMWPNEYAVANCNGQTAN